MSYRLVTVLAWGVLLSSIAVGLAVQSVSFWIFTVPILGVIFATSCVVQYRRGRVNAVLTMLSTAANRGLPLETVLDTFAGKGLGWGSARAAQLADWLRQGVPLPDALSRTGQRLGESARVMLLMGQQTGNLRAALASLASDRRKYRPIWRGMVSQLCYLITILCMAMLYLSFTMFRVVPSFQRIFSEFRTPMPLLTQVDIGLASFVNDYAFLTLPLFVALVMYLIVRYLFDIRIDLPIVRRFIMPYHTANLLQALALVAHGGQSMQRSVESLAETYPRRFIRRRLKRAAARMRQGEDWLDSLRAERLIRPADLAVLRAAQRVGNLPWAMREMADGSLRRLAVRLQTASNLLFPLVLLAIGLVVALYVVGMFLPLPALIWSLT
ncbi:MAG: type II secretion system F family protein [Planctomycetia bacterium]|nr:type II secretion system F family protein [Planctomycetia bacterium]